MLSPTRSANRAISRVNLVSSHERRDGHVLIAERHQSTAKHDLARVRTLPSVVRRTAARCASSRLFVVVRRLHRFAVVRRTRVNFVVRRLLPSNGRLFSLRNGFKSNRREVSLEVSRHDRFRSRFSRVEQTTAAATAATATPRIKRSITSEHVPPTVTNSHAADSSTGRRLEQRSCIHQRRPSCGICHCNEVIHTVGRMTHNFQWEMSLNVRLTDVTR
jgi:hypothetical protein